MSEDLGDVIECCYLYSIYGLYCTKGSFFTESREMSISYLYEIEILIDRLMPTIIAMLHDLMMMVANCNVYLDSSCTGLLNMRLSADQESTR